MAKKKKVYELKDIIPLLTEEQLSVASGMIEDAIFIEKQLVVLRDQIEREGVVEEYQNGSNQFGKKQSVAVATYLQMQKQYGVIIKYLTDLIPNSSRGAANVSLLDWVESH